jgi:hypothetical protein
MIKLTSDSDSSSSITFRSNFLEINISIQHMYLYIRKKFPKNWKKLVEYNIDLEYETKCMEWKRRKRRELWLDRGTYSSSFSQRKNGRINIQLK